MMLRRCCTLLILFGLTLLASVGKAENLFISDFRNGNVIEFTASGSFVRDFVPAGSGGLNGACNLRFGLDGNLYVANLANVKKYDGTTGAYLGDFAVGLNSAIDIIFAPNGNAYVAEYATDSVSEFSSTGTLLRTFTDRLSTPEGLAFRSNGNLLVTNSYGNPYRNTITEIDLTTGVATTFATGLGEPVGIAKGYDGRYYVANFTYARSYGGTNPDTIQVMGAEGGVSSTWNNSSLDGANYIVFTEGDLFITNFYNRTISRFNGTTGAFVSAFSVGDFSHNVQGIAVRHPADSVVAVGGIIALQGTQNAVQSLDFTFHPTTGSDFTRTTTLNFAGSYNLDGIPADRYTVSIKGAKWLRKTISVDARSGDVTTANATLLAGDANNDNFADIADLLLLIGHYNQASGIGNYLDAVDFNCDCVNDITDLLLLVANYNKQGD